MSDASSESGGGGGRGPHLRTNIAQMQAQVHWAGRNLPYPAPVSSHDVDALTPSRYQVPSSRTSWQVGTLPTVLSTYTVYIYIYIYI